MGIGTVTNGKCRYIVIGGMRQARRAAVRRAAGGGGAAGGGAGAGRWTGAGVYCGAGRVGAR